MSLKLGAGILSVVLWNEIFKKRFKEFLNLQKETYKWFSFCILKRSYIFVKEVFEFLFSKRRINHLKNHRAFFFSNMQQIRNSVIVN
jgi:hypothetical protein